MDGFDERIFQALVADYERRFPGRLALIIDPDAPSSEAQSLPPETTAAQAAPETATPPRPRPARSTDR